MRKSTVSRPSVSAQQSLFGRADVAMPDISREQMYQDRHSCLQELAKQVCEVAGPARNYQGLMPQQLELPVDEQALRMQEVRRHQHTLHRVGIW